MEQRLLCSHARHTRASLPPRSSLTLRDRLVDYEIVERAVLLRTGELTAEQLTIACLARLYEFEDAIKAQGKHDSREAFMPVDAQQALTQARLADQWLSNIDDPRGPAPPLCGIALGVRTSLASVMRNDRQLLKNSPLVSRLNEQGAVLLGPFATYSEPDDRLDVMPAVARLCGAVLIEAGDDGLVMPTISDGASAIKPSLGFAMGWDVPGSIARSVRDAALLLAAIAGTGVLEMHSPPLQWPMTARKGNTPLFGTGIGVPLPPTGACGPACWKAFESLRSQLSRLGARVLEFPDPLMQAADGWEAALRDNNLDFMLLVSPNTPDAQDWPTVSFPIGRSHPAAPIRATFCGPHLSDAQIIQAALDVQARYPQHPASLMPRSCQADIEAARRTTSRAAVTLPGKAWPTG